MSKIRLDRFISNQIPLPRSRAAELIRRGEVTVDGVVVKQPSFSFDAEKTSVICQNKPVCYKKHVYIILNKPKGVLSASTDKSRKTVIDLVPDELKRRDLAPVGRLDKDTTGLLIITDDGEFAHNCISPKKMIPKRYIAELDGVITDEIAESFKNGLVLADGTKCMPAELEKLTENTVAVTVYEGKYHQIKRMFGVVGLGVNELHRESIGLLKLPKNLGFGQAKEVNLDELLNYVINIKQNIN